jgi:hypothetical protein
MDDEDLRLLVYATFAATGRPPDRDLLDAHRDGLQRLHDQRHLVLRDGEIIMAHPFSSIPLGFSVMGRSTLWWGGCCWDSFALAHLLPGEESVLVATRCPGCRAALAWDVGREAPPAGGEVAHFLVPAARIWDDVVHTCGHQRLFCSEACVDAWLERAGEQRGHVMDLATLWRLASRWYEGRLERGYVRREPSEARDYFRSVGLDGVFWGL